MKKTRILAVVSAILCMSISFIAIASEEKESTNGSEMHVGVFGASFALPRRAGFIISNDGDTPILDIHWTFSIKSLSNDYTDISFEDELESLDYNDGFVFLTSTMNGFGLVTLSITATSSNAGEVTETLYGIQIGNIILSNTYFLSWY